MEHKKIAFIGGGNMGRALVKGLVSSGYPADLVTVADLGADKLEAIAADFGVRVTQSNAEAASWADSLVLAVKPQVMAEALGKLTQDIGSYGDKTIISLAAGVSVARLSGLMNGHSRIVRLMPNTPALIGEGATGAFASAGVSESEKQFVSGILNAVGKSVWVEKEEDINAVTAASGSAPAYFFLLMQYMTEKAVEMGLSKEAASTLISQTALGSAKMVLANPDTPLETLRAQVTSKGGTTFAAITSFEQANLKKAVSDAMDACSARASEMQSLF